MWSPRRLLPALSVLLPFVRDLYDPVLEDLLSNQVGEAANKAAELWAGSLPNGGPVMLTDSGRAFALVGHSWTYLGDLDSGS